MGPNFVTFDTWSGVLEAARNGADLWYQAPFDRIPHRILVVKVFKNGTLRIDPLSNQADKFTANKGHLDRFRLRLPMEDRPLAARGLTSYRLRGRYGYIMIGARDHEDAMREAARSTPNPDRKALEIWNGDRYVKVFGAGSGRVS